MSPADHEAMVNLTGYGLLCVMSAIVFAGADDNQNDAGYTVAQAVKTASLLMDAASEHWQGPGPHRGSPTWMPEPADRGQAGVEPG